VALAKTTTLEVQGVDCSIERMESSRRVALHNDVNPTFFVSDLFCNLKDDSRFDLIYFNPPYVPTRQGRQLRLTARMHADSDCVWDGGADGTEVLQRYLREAHHFLAPHGRLLFGVQPVFLAADVIHPLVRAEGWRVVDEFSPCCIPSVVYVLRPIAGSQPAER
jgi:release factor glutamine methyltransferase